MSASPPTDVSPDAPLAGLRVIDLADPYSALAGKVLADLGADVLLIEPPEGAPLRRTGPSLADQPGPDRSLPFWHYRGSLRHRVLDLSRAADRTALRHLLDGADVLLEVVRPDRLADIGLTAETIDRDFPNLITVSLSPFGRTGPRADWLGGDYLAWAAGGPMSLIGLADREPLDAPWQATHFAGLWAAIGALAALAARGRLGRGQHLELSLQEAAAAHASAAVIFASYADQRQIRRGGDSGLVCPSVVAPCRDGHIQVVTVVRRQWLTLIRWLAEDGAADGFDAPAYVDVVRRMQERDRLHATICRWTANFAKHDLFRRGQAKGLAFGVVQTMADLAADPQLAHRGFFRSFRHPLLPAPTLAAGPPYRFAEGVGGRVWGGGSLQEGTGGSPVTQHPTPLAGLRILDFTWVWAGPFGTRILGDLGADVIKVEQRGAGDGARWNPPFKDGQRGIDRSGLFNDLNHNKRSLTVDLKRPEGRALIERLAVEWADVLIENFGAGTLERLGLTPENLLAKQPRLIVVRLAGFGQTGPYRDYLGYAPAIHALAGLTSSIRYPDRPPIGVAIPLGDYAGGLYGVVATIATVLDRERTGRGRVVDLSQFEAAVGMVGPGLMEAAVSGREPEPRINRIDPASGAARWLVRCKPGVWQPTAQGAPAEPIDRWLALAPETDSQWAALADRVGAADRPGRDRATGAAEAAAAVYEAVSRWAAGKEVVAAASELQAEGVPAAPVQEAWELLRADPHLAARGFYVRLDHPACGEVVTSRLPVTFSATAPAIRRPAPLLGEHNTEILGGILGLTDDQIGDLVLNEVI